MVRILDNRMCGYANRPSISPSQEGHFIQKRKDKIPKIVGAKKHFF